MRFRFIILTALVIALMGMTVFAMHDVNQPDQAKARLKDKDVQQMIQDLKARLVQLDGAKALSEVTYVGSNYCMACHTWAANIFPQTPHMNFLHRPIVGKVNYDADGNGVDDFEQGMNFNDMDTAFNAFKPYAPVLSIQNGKFWMTIGDLSMEVVFAQADARLVVRIPVTDTDTGFSGSVYFSPMSYGGEGNGWSPYSTSNWYNSDNTPKWGTSTTTADLTAHTGNYSKNCVGCHSTGMREIGQTASGEWVFHPYPATLYAADDPSYFDYDGDGIFDLMNIGCESCHGGGSLHILGQGDPEQIVNPNLVDAQRGNDICGRCHTKPASVPNHTFSWPFHDDTMTDWTPRSADPLADYMVDESTYWGDNFTTRVSRPYVDFYHSSKPTYPYHSVTCFECHSPHSKRQEAQITTRITDGDLTIPTAVDNNTLCLACHATHGDFADITKEMVADYDNNVVAIGTAVSAHSHHPYGPDRMMGLSRCTLCHMPVTNGHGQLTGHSHTFEPIPPQKTLLYQMPNACAQSCHRYLVNIFGLGIDANPANYVWNEPFDIDLATELMKWYGPDGTWWVHTVEKAHQDTTK